MMRKHWIAAALTAAGMLAAGVSARAGDDVYRLGLDKNDAPTIFLGGPDARDADVYEVGHGGGGHGGGGHGGGGHASFHGGGGHASFHGSSFHGSSFHGSSFHANNFHNGFHNNFHNNFHNGFHNSFHNGFHNNFHNGFWWGNRGWWGRGWWGNRGWWGWGWGNRGWWGWGWPYWGGWGGGYGYSPYYNNWWYSSDWPYYDYYPSTAYYGGQADCPSATLVTPPVSLDVQTPSLRTPPAGFETPPMPRPQRVPADGTFPYDGGPRNPPPMPKSGPIFNDAPATLPLTGRVVSLPKPKYVYPAYGEKLLLPSNKSGGNTYIIKADSTRPVGQ